MTDPLVLVSIFFIILCIITIIRLTEVIPNLYIYFTSRKGYSVKFPDDYGLKTTVISYLVGERNQEGWFFPSEESNPASILLIPDWTFHHAFSNSLKTAGVLQLMGYNVLLPLVHDVDESSQQIVKMSFTTQYYQKVIEKAYEYLLSQERLDKRQIAIFSEALGTVFASSLVKDYPIKAIVLENGPITLSHLIAGKIPQSGFISTIIGFFLRFIFWPFFWKTRWNNRSTLSMLHSCPSFQISIFNHKNVPSHDIFNNYAALYKPKQIWIEHALLPQGGIRDTWPQEFFSQVKTFYNRWLTKEPATEWHYDQKVKKQKQGYIVQQSIHALPPQMDQVPLCISLADKKNLIHERICFEGAEMTLEYQLPFKPHFISTIPYYNVQKNDKISSWFKLDAQQALERTIDSIASLELSVMAVYEERYSKIKKEISKDLESISLE